ncbi:MAG: glycoside hydrolase family 15 protein [Bacteriovoracia bacterium]
MKFLFLFVLCLGDYAAAANTPLVSGNGFGFAVFSQSAGALSKFYAHPYRFVRPDPTNEYAEGIETANFLRSLAWAGETATSSGYVAESQVIEAKAGPASDFYFLPYGLSRNALITGTTRADSCVIPGWSAAAKVKRKISRGSTQALLLSFSGVEENLLAVPLGKAGKARFSGTCLEGGPAWAFVSVEEGDQAADVLRDTLRWAGTLSIEKLVARELAEVEAWRVVPKVKFLSENERRLWRQSEMVLRMGQSREPNRGDRFNNGLIVASLPEGMWFVSWVRDMAYAVVALTRMGHQEEARAGMAAYFRARPSGKMQSWVKDYPYQISVVRYFGNGAEEPFFTMAGSPNVEFDNWGLVLWALTEYVEKFGDDSFLQLSTHRGPLFSVARDFVARPLVGNLVPFEDGKIVDADTSIWEEHQWDKQHFVFSSAAALQGLDGFSRLAKRTKDGRAAAKLQKTVGQLGTGILKAFTGNGFLAGTAEGNYKNLVDAAALEAINLGAVKDQAIIRSTIEQMEALKVESGGYRRVRGDTQYEKHEFLFSNFSLARNFLRLGEGERGFPLIEKMVNKSAADNFLVPEMYISERNEQFLGEIGAPTGSIPMVGYGAGIYVMYLLERELGVKYAN